jgi:hypothetical protein
MRFVQLMRDTLFPYANFRGFLIVQLPGIMREMKKVTRTDRFCLTELVGEGYFASSPPSGCGGKEAASATCCGGIVDSEVYLGMAGGFPVSGEVRLVGGMLWH